LPEGYTLLKVRSSALLEFSDAEPIPEDWRERLELTQMIGDQWLAERTSALMRVPSSIVSETWNYLLNPEHPDAGLVKIVGVTQERYDPRLFRFGSWKGR
jgi:RES domain-containing protein